MPREFTIPPQFVREEIRSLEELPAIGAVQVMVGLIDGAGAFIQPQNFTTYVIEGANYRALVGEPAAWAPDKPAGTYRNEDLWHFVDLLRAK